MYDKPAKFVHRYIINIIATILVTTSRKLIAFSISTVYGERVYSVQSTINQSDFIQSYSQALPYFACDFFTYDQKLETRTKPRTRMCVVCILESTNKL